MDALTRAVALFDSKAQFARAVGCFPQQVNRWLKTGKVVATRCAAAEAACIERAQFLLTLDRKAATPKQLASIAVLSEGLPTRAQLRPDVFGDTPASPQRRPGRVR